PGARGWIAWIILSSAIFDRFGMGWSEAYTGDPATLTPEAALKWAMGADTPEQALSRWMNRIRQGQGVTGSRPDLNPERMAPKLTQLPPGPGPNPNYSPQTYRITAELDAAKGMVSGEMHLTWQNGEAIPLDALYFNVWANAERHRMYGGFSQIEGVTVDGKPATFVAKGIDLKVELGRTVQPGEKAEVTVRFATHLTGNQTYGLALTDGKRFTLSQFYPILGVLDDRGWNLHALSYTGGDPYSERADYQVNLTVPAGFLVGGAGRQTARVENAKTWTYSYDAPGVPAWSAVGGLDWMESKVTVDSTSVRLLGPLPAWHEQVKAAAAESLRFLQQQLGAFPYPELVVVHGTLKLPGIASAGDVDAQGVYKNGLANSLASQWFGAYVGNDQWTEAWLDEGLAKYMEHEAARAMGRGQLTFGVRQSDRPRDGRVTQNGMAFLMTRNHDLMGGEYGAIFFEALEERIGSAAMNGLLRQWLGEYGGRTATGADLVRLAEATAGPLEPFRKEYAVDVNDRRPYEPVPVLGYDE
ncbi:MAG TPA: M1 family aminopeptidase, partial [Symbiobacteriaceae bacterium]|nr:M1 family aminopeptidase [Symbiobacteriaceae bacterium]